MGNPLLSWLDPILNPLACLPPAPESTRLSHQKADSVLKRLEATLQQKLRYALIGEKRSIARGQGLDFADLREYTPGDDIRKIDWNVFARTLSPHVREYHEEKQLTLWLAVDCTPSMRFGHRKTKLELAIELAGLLALMAEKAHHRLGAFIIRNGDTGIIPPRAGHAQAQQIMQALLDAAGQSEGAMPADPDPLPAACTRFSHLVQKHSTVLFLSDFLSPSPKWQVPLGQLSRHAQMIYLVLQDPVEQTLPSGLGLLSLMDPETGQHVRVDSRDARLHQTYAEHTAMILMQRVQLLRETGIPIVASTDEDPVRILLSLVQANQNRTARRPA